MELVILSAAITMFLLAVAILSRAGRRADQMKRRLSESRAEAQGNGYGDELKKPFYDRIVKPLLLTAGSRLRKLFRRGVGKQNQKDRERILRLLAAADLSLGYEEYSALRLGTGLALAGGGAWLASFTGLAPSMIVAAGFCGFILGVLLPGPLVKSRAKARGAAILRELPEVMDLLVVSVEAGLGLDAAVVRLYERNKSPLMTELMKSVRDVQMGLPRRESLKAMADRSDVQELRSFAVALIQAEQLGVPIKKVLRSQVNQLRQAYRQRCEARAMKAPVKMIIPMVVFIFPVLFIILLGPSAEQIMEIFG